MRYKQRYERVQRGVELTRVTCDICGHDVGRGGGFYDQTEAQVQAAIGKVWPDGDSRERVWIDCCGKCFEEHVVPALQATLGVTFRREPMERLISGEPYPDAAWEDAVTTKETK